MKTIEEIYQELLNAFAERAGFIPEESCDLAVRLWAVAAQLQALQIQTNWVLEQSFPQTAQGEYLDHHATMRGLQREQAKKAAGTIRFLAQTEQSGDVTIPAGTVCMTEAETRFRTVEDAVLPAGSGYVDVEAEAMEGGSNGNAVAGAIRYLTACPMAITGCTNLEAFAGGMDAETDSDLRGRVLESYQRLPNGANAAWYEQTAENMEGVAAAKAVGRARGTGTVDVYITGEEGLPSEELLAQVQAELQQQREIAVDVTVAAPETTEVAVDVALAVKENNSFAEVQAAARQTITAFFNGRLLGKGVKLAELGDLVYHLDGVENYRFSAPAQDLAGTDTVLPVLGTLTVTEMEA